MITHHPKKPYRVFIKFFQTTFAFRKFVIVTVFLHINSYRFQVKRGWRCCKGNVRWLQMNCRRHTERNHMDRKQYIFRVCHWKNCDCECGWCVAMGPAWITIRVYGDGRKKTMTDGLSLNTVCRWAAEPSLKFIIRIHVRFYRAYECGRQHRAAAAIAVEIAGSIERFCNKQWRWKTATWFSFLNRIKSRQLSGWSACCEQ